MGKRGQKEAALSMPRSARHEAEHGSKRKPLETAALGIICPFPSWVFGVLFVYSGFSPADEDGCLVVKGPSAGAFGNCFCHCVWGFEAGPCWLVFLLIFRPLWGVVVPIDTCFWKGLGAVRTNQTPRPG